MAIDAATGAEQTIAAADALTCADVAVGYPAATVLSGVELAVRPGEVVAILGPSGSGKSTLLQTIAGFIRPLAGRIRLAGRTVATERIAVPPEARDIGMVFQNYALWPHLSVIDTVAYPRRRRRVPARQARVDAMELLRLLRIAHLADRRPAELSGGEQQRVGLARALARDAALYLFDEPTAHLDAHLRAAFQLEVVSRGRAASLYATHDAAEALGIADRVAIVGAGRMVQLGSPAEVYERPVTGWAARLTGPASVLTGQITSVDRETVGLRVGTAEIIIAAAGLAALLPSATPRRLLIRPEWAAAGGPLSGLLRSVAFRGSHTDYLVAFGSDEVLVRLPGMPRHQVGERLDWTIERAWILPDRADEPEMAMPPTDFAHSGRPGINPEPARRRGVRRHR